MDNILTATSVIAVIVLAVTQLIKESIPNNKWLPVINVVVGIIIGIGYAASFANMEIILYAWGGAIAGLGAGGFYDLGKGFLKDF
jgi:uncharacterized membrane protein